MKLLLDTQLMLWWLADSPKLSRQARAFIADPENTVFVSAATRWEIRIKEKLGKLDVPSNLIATVRSEEFEWIPVSAEHADATMDLPLLHRDPFDRMLVAQAKWMGITLLTSDPMLAQYGNFVKRV